MGEPPGRRLLRKLGRRLAEPLVDILLVAGLVSGLSGDWPGFVIISFDAVDEADPARPHAWDMRAVLRFTLVMRPLSPVVDLATSLGLALGPLAPLLGFPRCRGRCPGPSCCWCWPTSAWPRG
ncbi:hypothetical protein ACFQY5_00570 [Paeniroseomonas aquatica]|uniref:hypothetical protein n=1 Tax=Paeniroseomonas aquatica TaxID=373043 RepID=UPI00360D4844